MTNEKEAAPAVAGATETSRAALEQYTTDGAAQKLTITRWTDVKGKHCKELHGTWPEFGGWLQNLPGVEIGNRSIQEAKETCPLIKLARFGNVPKKDTGALRHNDNVLSITGIEGDYDAKQVTPEQAIERLEGFNLKAAIAPTFTSTPDAPKWRVLTPLSEEAHKSERNRYIEILNGMLGGILASESATLSQSYFVGVPAGADYTVLHTFDDPEEGHTLDELDDLDEIRIQLQASKDDTINEDDIGGGLDDWKQAIIEAESIHPALVRFCAHFVSKGYSDKALRLMVDGLAVYVEQHRGKERADLLRNKELDDAIRSARDKGFAPREYGAILADAQSMDEGTDPDDIDALIKETRELSPTQRRKVFDTLKRQTRMPLGTLNEALKSGDETTQNDHLTLARHAVQRIGSDNVIAAQSFVWLWNGDGVWNKSEDRTVRGWIQSSLSEDGEEVKKTLVDSVTDLFTTDVFLPSHEFDIGPPECVNTETGEVYLNDYGRWDLMPHEREHYRTTQIPVEYNVKADAPKFEQFLADVFKGDDDAGDKAQALLEMMGYTLMAHCRHERFIILVGTGANGKSVLLSVLEALCGSENVAGVQPSQFSNRFQRAHLHGKLANIVTEIEQGEVIDDAALKGIVSGEPATVEHKFRNPFQMRPFSTCWFGTNHMPHTRDFSDALFRRALIVEFNNVFKPEYGNCDDQLKEKLLEELPGILNMALDAYAKAVEVGFTMPSSSEKARDDWRMEADQVAQFVEAECERDKYSEEGAQDLYNRYTEWAHDVGIHKKVTMKSFRDRLERLGFGKRRGNKGRYVTGIRCSTIVRFNAMTQ